MRQKLWDTYVGAKDAERTVAHILTCGESYTPEIILASVKLK
jgi:hypothetical protein